MKILFISAEGDLIPLSKRVKREGHSTFLVVTSDVYREEMGEKCDPLRRNGSILPEGIESLLKRVTPDICVTDSGTGMIGEYVKRQGVKTWGADRWSELMMGEYGEKVMDSMNVFPMEQPEGGDVVFGVGAFSNGDILYNPFLCVQEKGMMNRGVGVQNVGGICIQVLHSGHPFLKDLMKVEQVIKKISYKGMITLTDRLEAGFSLPLFSCLFELSKGNIVDVLRGEMDSVTKEWASCTRITLPPFPSFNSIYSDKIHVEKQAEKHVWMVNRSGGDLGWVSARGEKSEEYTPLREARRRTLRTISNMKKENDLAELQYRTDVGVRSAQILDKYGVFPKGVKIEGEEDL